jgi:hypothetical protein
VPEKYLEDPPKVPSSGLLLMMFKEGGVSGRGDEVEGEREGEGIGDMRVCIWMSCVCLFV